MGDKDEDEKKDPAEQPEQTPAEQTPAEQSKIEKVELSEDDIQWIKAQRAIKANPHHESEEDDQPQIEQVVVLKTKAAEQAIEPAEQPQQTPAEQHRKHRKTNKQRRRKIRIL